MPHFPLPNTPQILIHLPLPRMRVSPMIHHDMKSHAAGSSPTTPLLQQGNCPNTTMKQTLHSSTCFPMRRGAHVLDSTTTSLDYSQVTTYPKSIAHLTQFQYKRHDKHSMQHCCLLCYSERDGASKFITGPQCSPHQTRPPRSKHVKYTQLARHSVQTESHTQDTSGAEVRGSVECKDYRIDGSTW